MKAGQTSGFVYLIGALGDSSPCKIGFATNVDSRLRTLQIGNPDALEVLAVFPGTTFDEAELHHEFARYRLRGEWFSEAPLIREAFTRIEDELEDTFGARSDPDDAFLERVRQYVFCQELVEWAAEASRSDYFNPAPALYPGIESVGGF